MSLKGAFVKDSQQCQNVALIFKQISELASKGLQAEHFFEIQMIKQMLETAITGILPNVPLGSVSVTPVLTVAKLLETNLVNDWNKLYPTFAGVFTQPPLKAEMLFSDIFPLTFVIQCWVMLKSVDNTLQN